MFEQRESTGASVAVERERVEAAALLDPERLVEARAQLVGLALEPLGERLRRASTSRASSASRSFAS